MSIALTEAFLGHVFAGRIDDALSLVSPDARFIGSRPDPSPDNPLFGTHIGPEGARRFFATFATLIEPGDFSIDGRFGSGNFACLFGTFRHKVRATGLPFPSDWALITEAHEGKLALYHFYEDTEALACALHPKPAGYSMQPIMPPLQ